MSDELSSAPSAGAASVAGAAAPAPSAPSAPPEPASDVDAVRAAMTGEDPAGEAPEGAPAAEPAGAENEPPPSAEGGEAPGETPAEGDAADEVADLEMADLPAARKEYLKRDPEARAAWYFQQDMKRLGMTVPEAREYRKVFASPADAAFAMKGATAHAAIKRTLASPDPNAPIQALDLMRQHFGEGADRIVRTVAQHLDVVDPQGALARDAAKIHELFEDLAPQGDFEKEALATVWEMLERKSATAPKPKPPDDPEKRELEGLRAEKRQVQVASQRAMFEGATKAGEDAMRGIVESALAPARKLDVDAQILKDVSEGVFAEVRKWLVGHPTFQDQYHHTMTDPARSPEQRQAAAVELVKRWAEPMLVDLTAQRLKPYTRSTVKASQRRVGHAKEVASLADLGGTTAAAGSPTKIPRDLSLQQAAALLLR